MGRAFTASTKLLLFALFAFSVYRAAARPVTLGEAIFWDDLVRPPFWEALRRPDAWSGLLFAILSKRTVGLFRLSEFTLRLPAVISCGVLFLLLLRLASRRFWVALAMVASLPALLGWFSVADGRGVALAFCALALRWPRFGGLFFGLAIAASPIFAMPLGVLAVWCAFRDGIGGVERVIIPAVTTAFVLLIIPLSYAAGPYPQPAAGTTEGTGVKSAVQALRDRGHIRISASPSGLPLVQFYRARYRQRDWEITTRDPQYRIEP